MKNYDIVNGPKNVSAIVQGCMRMPSLSKEDAAKVIRTAYDCGINFYDHATCYGMGDAEVRFAEAFPLTGLKREDIFIQSKCGICPERSEFDWTKENIISSVDGILDRLKIEYLDTLLLHRPDVLFDPEEVAEAFAELEKNGKVKYFGVSNLVPMQIELLKKYVKQDLIINQVQLSLEQSQLIDQALYMNNKTTDMSVNRDGNALDYCRLKDITIQAWSPLQVGMFGGTFIDNPDFPELNKVLGELAEREGVSKAAIAIAWILRHPAKMQAIIGTMNPEHIKDICAATDVKLSHNDWYKLYLSAGKFLP
ncbi:aldo/keto reductase family oxidoreductase [uncultured Eubacterium sp.]|uniref:aldo/keto reductase n=1 Tax=uncultured Eubacterium sp. TaxID=165185 RepID=UPI000E93B481|nr:aldo/keto reductase [uncultured Eubacterium sp.]HAV89868.1 aldo/keto reductase [Eubacterium sp.]